MVNYESRPCEYNTPGRILNRILNMPKAENYTYIILGKPGPTGKTALCNELRRRGFNAFEISEDIFDLVDYKDDKNYFIGNSAQRRITIVLNYRLERGDVNG